MNFLSKMHVYDNGFGDDGTAKANLTLIVASIYSDNESATVTYFIKSRLEPFLH